MVIGRNYIGLEMGQVFANLGVKVTVVEALDRVAPLEEPEISEWMTKILTDQGITVVVPAKVVRAEAGETKSVATWTSCPAVPHEHEREIDTRSPGPSMAWIAREYRP